MLGGPAGVSETGFTWEGAALGSLIALHVRTYGSNMLALDLDAAKRIGVLLVAGFVILAITFSIVVKKTTTKLIWVLFMGGLALGAWTQRDELQDCADRVEAKVAVGDLSETTCSFFGTDVKIPAAGSTTDTTTPTTTPTDTTG